MSFLDRLRKMLAGPPHIQGGGEGGAEAVDQEYGMPDKAAPDARGPVDKADETNTHWRA